MFLCLLNGPDNTLCICTHTHYSLLPIYFFLLPSYDDFFRKQLTDSRFSPLSRHPRVLLFKRFLPVRILFRRFHLKHIIHLALSLSSLFIFPIDGKYSPSCHHFSWGSISQVDVLCRERRRRHARREWGRRTTNVIFPFYHIIEKYSFVLTLCIENKCWIFLSESLENIQHYIDTNVP